MAGSAAGWTPPTSSRRPFSSLSSAWGTTWTASPWPSGHGSAGRPTNAWQTCAGNIWGLAVAALERAARLAGDGDLYHKFFLAMAYWQLGRRDQARESYDQCVEWMGNRRATDNAELRRFRAEASALLGIPDASAAPEKNGEPTKGEE